MIDLTKLFYFIFGLITLIGGIQGFVSAGSRPSLIAGGVCGVLLLIAGYLLMGTNVNLGLVLGLLICLALAGRFLPAYLKTRDIWPSGVEGMLGVVGVLLTIVAFVKK